MEENYVVVYLKAGKVVAVCPPDKEPPEGSFDNWVSGTSKEEALAALDFEAANQS